MEATVGRLERVGLRSVWPHEAADFTPWLQKNLDVLNELLDFNLSAAEKEQKAGNFSVDLVAEDETDYPVVIENQLEPSDHDHLGKLLTYLASIESKRAIWIVSEPRTEHVKAINWLNESSGAEFYLLKVEAVKIGDSVPAPLLTLIVGPSKTSRAVGATKEHLAERYDFRQRFSEGLLARARQKTNLHTNVSPSYSNWISTGAGKTGVSYAYVIRQHDAHVEFYIDPPVDEQNPERRVAKEMFDVLHRRREEIEGTFGEPLEWQQLEAKWACRIKLQIDQGGYRDEARWSSIYDSLIEAMIRLEKAFKPHIPLL
jgi:hypothetical protein